MKIMKILYVQKQSNKLKIQYMGRFSFEKVKTCVKEYLNTDVFEIAENIIFDTTKPVFITIKSKEHENKKWIRK